MATRGAEAMSDHLHLCAMLGCRELTCKCHNLGSQSYGS
jgi:hypothetical protein